MYIYVCIWQSYWWRWRWWPMAIAEPMATTSAEPGNVNAKGRQMAALTHHLLSVDAASQKYRWVEEDFGVLFAGNVIWNVKGASTQQRGHSSSMSWDSRWMMMPCPQLHRVGGATCGSQRGFAYQGRLVGKDLCATLPCTNSNWRLCGIKASWLKLSRYRSRQCAHNDLFSARSTQRRSRPWTTWPGHFRIKASLAVH